MLAMQQYKLLPEAFTQHLISSGAVAGQRPGWTYNDSIGTLKITKELHWMKALSGPVTICAMRHTIR
jgi:hypothetical protein